MTTDHPTKRSTRNGPRICLHYAPIETDCLDCAREICERFEEGIHEHFEAEVVLRALEQRAAGLGEAVQVTLESFLIEDIRIIRWVRVIPEDDSTYRYQGTDGWGSTQAIEREAALGRIERKGRLEHKPSDFHGPVLDPALMGPEPEPNNWKCQSGIPHVGGQCPDCPS